MSKDSSSDSSVAKITDHAEAFREIVQHLTSPQTRLVQRPEDIKVVGHRVVHGADRFSSATLITHGAAPRAPETARGAARRGAALAAR